MTYSSIALCIFCIILLVSLIKRDFFPKYFGVPIDGVVVKKNGDIKNELFIFSWVRLLKRGSESKSDVLLFIFSFSIMLVFILLISFLWVIILPVMIIFLSIRKLLKTKIKNNLKKCR